MTPTVQTNSSEAGVGTLVQGIVGDLGDLIRHEFRFARTELKADLRKTREAGLLLVSGMILSFVGLVFLGIMLANLFHWLSILPEYRDPNGARLPLWGGYAIVSGLFLMVGLVLLGSGVAKFKSFDPLPDQTAENLKENVQWLTKNANSK